MMIGPQSRFLRRVPRNCNAISPTRQRPCTQPGPGHAYYTHSNKSVKSVAILGGGITGLTAAFYLATRAPGVPITIYEASSRLGGWMRTYNFETSKGRVQFEAGPSTIRPKGESFLVTLDMMRELSLEDRLFGSTSSSPFARNKYIYFPDKLVKLPNNVLEGLFLPREPLYEGLRSSFLWEMSKPRRAPEVTDESVGSFISRRFSPKVAQNLVSPVLHGIYAGDLDRLSAKSVLGRLWKTEEDLGSLTKAIFRKEAIYCHPSDLDLIYDLGPPNEWLLKSFKSALILRFLEGMEALPKSLAKYLEKVPNVRIKTAAEVKAITQRRNSLEKPIEVHMSNNLPSSVFSHVISTLPAALTSSLFPNPVPPLSIVEAVTVQVVNLYYENPNLLPVEGFGYLIPKSIPPEQNPENVLGVIFPQSSFRQENEIAAGTRLTIMMGGHYWNGRTVFPSEQEAIENARNVLKRHLRIVDPPALAMVSTNQNCIPQYTVGHSARMGFAHELMKIQWGGRVAVAGPSYRGVGINDSTRSAYEVVKQLLTAGSPLGLEREEWTGLSYFAGPDMLRIEKKKTKFIW